MNYKVINEPGAFTTDPESIKWIMKKYYKQLCVQQFGNLDKMHHFLKTKYNEAIYPL